MAACAGRAMIGMRPPRLLRAASLPLLLLLLRCPGAPRPPACRIARRTRSSSTGAKTPALVGTTPGKVVAFRWDGEWRQVPVQVDERAMVDYAAVRQTTGSAVQPPRLHRRRARSPGADPDPMLDGNDEIAAMAQGQRASAPMARAAPEAASRRRRRRRLTSHRSAAGGVDALPLPVRLEGQARAIGRQALRRLRRSSSDSGDYKSTYDFERHRRQRQRAAGQPRGLDRQDALLLPAPALALGRGRAQDQSRRRHRRRHPRRRQGSGRQPHAGAPS